MITFSTCFYIVKSKFMLNTYVEWISNFLSMITDTFNVVLYTDDATLLFLRNHIEVKESLHLKIVIKPFHEFYTYQYREKWINNSEKNTLLHFTDWELNMIWSEKIAFVNETIKKQYFSTDWYGWCDIGYFRNQNNQMLTSTLVNKWPNKKIVSKLDNSKIIYGCVNKNNVQNLIPIIMNKNKTGLPVNPIPENQVSIAGGFFLIYKDKIDWWHKIYYDKLELYFTYNYLVKDDQMIIIDCIINNMDKFKLCEQFDIKYSSWFMFHVLLLYEPLVDMNH